VPLASDSVISTWATEQAKLIAKSIDNPRLQLTCAAAVLGYGGDPVDLPIVKKGNEFVNQESLALWEDIPDQIILYSFSLASSSIADDDVELAPNVLGIYEGVSLRFPRQEARQSLRILIKKALASAWGCDLEQLISYSSGKILVGTKKGKPEESWQAVVIRKPQDRNNDGGQIGFRFRAKRG
jgi:hypothetical protein